MTAFKYLITLALFGQAFSSFSQFVNVPDPNFMQALVAFGVDGNNDGQISTLEAESTDSLVVSGALINDLTGVEAFINLSYLNIADNNLNAIDLSALSFLETLDFSTNVLLELDLTGNPALKYLKGHNNYNFQHVDLSNCAELVSIECTSNQLQTLDLRANTKLKNIGISIRNVPTFDLSKNTLLESLSISEAYQITELDLSQNTNLSFLRADHTQKLDSLDLTANKALKEVILQNGRALEFLNLQGLEDLEVVTTASSRRLTDLQMEGCYNLTNLNCSSNNLDSLNFSNHKRLKRININRNKFTKIDISNLDSLSRFNCAYNELQTLDLSNNPLLSWFSCQNNKLTELDLTNNLVLYNFYCADNEISELINFKSSSLQFFNCSGNKLKNLSLEPYQYIFTLRLENNELTQLSISNISFDRVPDFDASGNPDLNCIQINDSAKAAAAWTKIDPQSYFNEDCQVVVTALEEHGKSNQLELYPNPSKGKVFINTPVEYTNVQLMNSQGVVVRKEEHFSNQLDFSDQPAGVYILLFVGVDFSIQQTLLLE